MVSLGIDKFSIFLLFLEERKEKARATSLGTLMSQIDEVKLLNEAPSYSQQKFYQILKELDLNYHNGVSLVSDSTYNQLVELYNARFPEEPYEEVGAPPISGEKVRLPFYLGSLRKVTTEKQLDMYLKNYPGPYVVEDKVDGLTLLWIRNINREEKLYTRGRGTIGQDVSHLIPYLKLPKHTPPIAIRGEVVMYIKDFNEVGPQYGMRNARNLVSGLVNSKASFKPDLAQRLHFIAFRIMNSNDPPAQQILHLRALGFETPYAVEANSLNVELLTRTLEQRKSQAPYEMDGLVVYQNRQIEYPEGENPKQAIAFKIANRGVTTRVTYVEWNASKDKLLKPIVHYEPVQLPDATLTKASGYNARYILENGIGPGAIISVIRSGDVIPKIVQIIEKVQPQWPDPRQGEFKWDDNEVELVLLRDNPQSIAAKLEHFANKLDIKNLGPAKIALLVEAGFDTPGQIATITPEQLEQLDRVGSSLANKLVNEIREKTHEVPLPTLMAASGIFPGFSEKRFSAILDRYPNLLHMSLSPQQLQQMIHSVEGFGDVLSAEFADGWPLFKDWLRRNSMITYIDPARVAQQREHQRQVIEQMAHPLKGKKVVFSGVRNPAIQKQLENVGGIVASSVSGQTNLLVLHDVAQGRGKLEEARKKGIPYMSMDQFISQYFPQFRG